MAETGSGGEKKAAVGAHFDARIPVTSKEKILESSRCLGSTKNSQNKCPTMSRLPPHTGQKLVSSVLIGFFRGITDIFLMVC